MKTTILKSAWRGAWLGLALWPAVMSAEVLLEAKPVPRHSGFRMEGYWIWDPSVVQAPDGKWHFFASRWPSGHPMHPSWLLTSEIVRAEGNRPEGPFEFKEVIFSARGPGYWDGRSVFNPSVHEITEQGKKKYVMYYVGTTHPFANPNPGEKIEVSDPRVIVARSNKRIGVAVADHPTGPWQRPEQTILPTRPGHFDDFLTSNPAVAFRRDGTVYLMYKTRQYQGADKGFVHARMTLGAAVAPHYAGPYRRLTAAPLFSPEKFGEMEDPFVWEQEGLLHMIAKDMSGKICGERHGGVHAISRDGVTWELGKPLQSWSRSIVWDDGQKQILGSMERPYLLFLQGRPAFLLAAVADGPGGFNRASQTWNMVIPLKTSP
jgi:hypothetical protein